MDQYTNELTPEILADIIRSPIAHSDLSKLDDAQAAIEERETFGRKHPVKAIWRIATEGSRTRCGGVIAHVNHDTKLLLDNGKFAGVELVGDLVTYGNGKTARIVSGAGKASMYKGYGIALVGSVLDNGDEIISTPQGHSYLVTREGIDPGDDFLMRQDE